MMRAMMRAFVGTTLAITIPSGIFSDTRTRMDRASARSQGETQARRCASRFLEHLRSM